MLFPTIAKVRKKLDSLIDDLLVIADTAEEDVADIDAVKSALEIKRAEAMEVQAAALQFRSKLLGRK